MVVFPVLDLSSCPRETHWTPRLTLIIKTRQGEGRGLAVTQVTQTGSSGALGPPGAARGAVEGFRRGGRCRNRPRETAVCAAGRTKGKRNATHWVYPAWQPREARSCSGETMTLQSQPHGTPVPLPPEGSLMLMTRGRACVLA